MKNLESKIEPIEMNVDLQVKNMIIRDLTYTYDHLNEHDSLMRFNIAKAITDLHFKFMKKDL